MPHEKAKRETMQRCRSLLENRLKTAVEQLRQTGRLIRLQKGEFVPANIACWLESGKCVLSLDDSRGDSISLFYFRAGQLVNFLPLLVQCMPIEASVLKKKVPADFFHVKALVESRLYAIDNQWFMENFADDPGLLCLFLHSSVLNLIHSYIHVWNAPILSNTQRVCRLIIAHMDEEGNGEIPAYLSQAEISRHLSMHSITVAKIFGKLRRLGLISKQDGKLIVENAAALQAIADGLEKITY